MTNKVAVAEIPEPLSYIVRLSYPLRELLADESA